MIVVADTSPICYLILIDLIDVLPQLYGQIFVPERVRLELADKGAPSAVRTWISDPPPWLEVRTVKSPESISLQSLDPGERDAIVLAEELQANLMLLDDKAARKVAAQRSLQIIGLLGVLILASQQQLIDFEATIHKLKQTSFRISRRLLDDLVKRYG